MHCLAASSVTGRDALPLASRASPCTAFVVFSARRQGLIKIFTDIAKQQQVNTKLERHLLT